MLREFEQGGGRRGRCRIQHRSGPCLHRAGKLSQIQRNRAKTHDGWHSFGRFPGVAEQMAPLADDSRVKVVSFLEQRLDTRQALVPAIL